MTVGSQALPHGSHAGPMRSPGSPNLINTTLWGIQGRWCWLRVKKTDLTWEGSSFKLSLKKVYLKISVLITSFCYEPGPDFVQFYC